MHLPCVYPQGSGAAASRDVQSLVSQSTAALPPTPLSDDWLRGSAGQGVWGDGTQGWDIPALSLELAEPYFTGSGEDPSPFVHAGPASAPSTSTGTPDGAAPSPFASLSSYLADRWTTAEHGLDYVDAQCKGWADGLLRGSHPPFVHARDWEPTRRHRYLLPTASIVQLYAMGTPDSRDVLVSAIDSQLHQMQVNVCCFPLPSVFGSSGKARSDYRVCGGWQVSKHVRADDIAALQAVLLYCAMKTYRASNTAAEPVDRLSTRSCQVFFSLSPPFTSNNLPRQTYPPLAG